MPAERVRQCNTEQPDRPIFPDRCSAARCGQPPFQPLIHCVAICLENPAQRVRHGRYQDARVGRRCLRRAIMAQGGCHSPRHDRLARLKETVSVPFVRALGSICNTITGRAQLRHDHCPRGDDASHLHSPARAAGQRLTKSVMLPCERCS